LKQEQEKRKGMRKEEEKKRRKKKRDIEKRVEMKAITYRKNKKK